MQTKLQIIRQNHDKIRAKNGRFSRNSRLNGYACLKTGNFTTLLTILCTYKNYSVQPGLSYKQRCNQVSHLSSGVIFSIANQGGAKPNLGSAKHFGFAGCGFVYPWSGWCWFWGVFYARNKAFMGNIQKVLMWKSKFLYS